MPDLETRDRSLGRGRGLSLAGPEVRGSYYRIGASPSMRPNVSVLSGTTMTKRMVVPDNSLSVAIQQASECYAHCP